MIKLDYSEIKFLDKLNENKKSKSENDVISGYLEAIE